VKALPKGLGAEPKKLAALGGLLALLVGVLWWQHQPSGPTVAASTSPSTGVAPVPIPVSTPVPDAASAARTADPVIPLAQRHAQGGGNGFANSTSRTMEDFRPSLKVKDDLDVSKVDPRIREDLLAKVRAVPMEGGSRSLFEFSKPPEPPAPRVEAIKPGPPAVPVLPPAVTSASKAAAKSTAPPPPAPIPFKYYGYGGLAADGQLQGFFREGDANTGDIFPAKEGDLIKNRYKIIRIGIKSALVEDTTNHSQQPLPLPEEAQ
jgi:hypothetical protein